MYAILPPMYQKQSRKKELIRRTIVYALMTTAVVLLLAILMMMVLGYRFNFKTRSVQPTALIQYGSYPRGATVRTDGVTADRTPTKNTVLPGQRQFAMELAGYELWQKTLEVESSTVTWLDYVRLVPSEKKMTTVELENLPQVTSALASPDRRFMMTAGRDEAGAAVIALIDVRNSQRPEVKPFTLAPEMVTGVAEPHVQHGFTVVEWNATSRAALIRHTLNTGESEQTEWLWVDREDTSRVVNLTTLLNLGIRDVHLAEGKELYVLQENGDIRQASIDTGALSRPLVSGVESFSVHDAETLAYIGADADERVAGIWRDGWHESVVIMRAPQDERPFHVRASRYFNKDTVVVALGTEALIFRGTLPTNEAAVPGFVQSQTTFTFNRPIDILGVSANGRFVIVENESGRMSYDLERSSASQDIKKFQPTAARWLDGYHMWQISQEGQLVMQEFDGVNQQPLMPIELGLDPLLSHDGKFVYGFVRGEDGQLTLRRLAMTLN